MKTKTEKGFDAVTFQRKQRDELSKKLASMTKEEIVAYFKKEKAEKRKKSAK